jgi:CubicO group peptidase (beta-lactamase class C family)
VERSRLIIGLMLLATAPRLGLAQATFPGATWPASTPQASGINPKVLDSLDAEIRAGRYGYVDRMLVIRHGQLVYDQRYTNDYDSIYGDSASKRGALNPHDLGGPYNYFAPWWHPYYRRGSLHTLQSVTKTVTSVIIGVAVTRGDFPSIDTPILAWFDSVHVVRVDDRKRRLTIRHLLTMTAGLDWNEGLPYVDPNNSATQLEGSYDWIAYVINRPMSEDPGTRFNYNSGATELLAHIFRRATGTDIEEYAARHLFEPLGIRNWFWKRTPAGVVDTEGGLYLEATDLARIWYLFLQNGRWEGQQLVSPAWVQASLAPTVPVGPAPTAPRYGLAWWLYRNPRDTASFLWGGSGFGGQLPVAFPRHDMVVVFNGWNILPGRPSLPLRSTLDRLLGAVVDSGP